MNFSTSISTCMGKYATFKGRASRSECWWFYLFCTLILWMAQIVDALTDSGLVGIGYQSFMVILAILVPSLAVGARRLHDIGKSGWWQLLMLPGIFFFYLAETSSQRVYYFEPADYSFLIFFILSFIFLFLLYFLLSKESQKEENIYGPIPDVQCKCAE